MVRLVLEALRFAIGPVLLCRLVRLPTRIGRAGRIAVIVPARDEAGRIGPLLASLLEQRPAPAEVVVVDDGSSDGTAALVGATGLRVVSAPRRPDGWNGKQWACHVGAAATSAPVLCFVDADVALAPDALGRVAVVVDERGGLVSVQPHHVTGSVVEGLSLLPNLVSMMSVDAFGPLRDRLAPSGAFGPVLATRRGDYERAGGHEAVRAAPMEDVALASSYRRAGLHVTLFAGGDTVRFRMHDGGLRSVIEGWTCGLGDGARHVRVATVLLVAVWLSGVASAPLVAIERPALGLGLCVAYAGQLWWSARRIGSFPLVAPLVFPLGAVFFVAVFLRSTGRALAGRTVRWKGRSIGA